MKKSPKYHTPPIPLLSVRIYRLSGHRSLAAEPGVWYSPADEKMTDRPTGPAAVRNVVNLESGLMPFLPPFLAKKQGQIGPPIVPNTDKVKRISLPFSISAARRFGWLACIERGRTTTSVKHQFLG